ncbi:hypothetical protein GCE86_11005 [Micromonospora terminaliae]|uniref:Uncharacterized protein n=1 Tax=Micromonospora terminaliae TaxID=1914461 RepID=A0AAJ2ZEZ7_9ACTN|nr:hypothetical protein [Micromonospora terminaliae]NES27698.1 hypothetical protein [Micromonospora terminaliae]QGL47508.1 hypothetical protein GCE86_11005 [Micromonospora terminaliae]
MASRISFDALPGRPHPPVTTVPPRRDRPVFVDATGARQHRIRRAGVLVAVASLSYLPMAAAALLPGPATPLLPGPVSVGGAPSGGATRPPLVALSPAPTQSSPAPRSTKTADPRRAPAAVQRSASNERPEPRPIDPPPVAAPPSERPTPTTSPTPTPADPAPPEDRTPPVTPTPSTTTEPGTAPGVVG